MPNFIKKHKDALSHNGTDCTPPVLQFESFEGGGPSFNVEIEDRSVLSFSSSRRYKSPDHEELCGAGYTVEISFEGLKEGSTNFKVIARSPIAENFEALYCAEVDAGLRVTIKHLETKAPFGM
ncbi:MAG: hypothetical protein IJL63_04070 [Clostridia bacterium]|nr:hypothetical protein [Clostridia bacterium]